MEFLKQPRFILIVLTTLGALLHFYSLNWGAPFYFHPDERNIASAVSQLQFPEQLNPEFFAYGSLPIYVVFFTGLFANVFISPPLSDQISFEQAIIIGRIYSAFLATALIPILYFIGRKIGDKKTGLLAATLATFSTGFIQFAHFGTFEMWLTFFTVLLFWICLKILEKQTLLNLLGLGVISGVLVAIKISHIVILILPFLVLLLSQFKHKNTHHKINRLFSFLGSVIILAILVMFVYVITNPFVFLDFNSFLSSMQYESSVGLNTLPVFYTQGFYDTIPVVYQFLNIYPFLLNPVLTILVIPTFFYLLWQTWKTKSAPLFILNSLFIILFLSQAVLFIKWTRYMIPTLPFIFLIVALALQYTLKKTTRKFTAITITVVSFIFAVSYFVTAFVQTDTRLMAYAYAKNHILPTEKILSETYDLGLLPFNNTFANITMFNSYDMDSTSTEYNGATWRTALEHADYVILPSQRVLQPRLQNSKQFPVGHNAYASLLNGNARFEKIYETPCDIFCQIAYLGDPAFHFEQTATVFDRPTVYIFKKTF